jgi:hypothetical protein
MVDVDAKKETRLKGGFPILSFVYRGRLSPTNPAASVQVYTPKGEACQHTR